MEGSSSASPSSKAKDKARAREDSIGGGKESPLMPRRMSLMGAELEKVDHIVVEVGSPEAPRWISCVKSSQGFDWNKSLFLPPYMAREDDLEIRQDPITDVTISDEEARALLPDW